MRPRRVLGAMLFARATVVAPLAALLAMGLPAVAAPPRGMPECWQ